MRVSFRLTEGCQWHLKRFGIIKKQKSHPAQKMKQNGLTKFVKE